MYRLSVVSYGAVAFFHLHRSDSFISADSIFAPICSLTEVSTHAHVLNLKGYFLCCLIGTHATYFYK